MPKARLIIEKKDQDILPVYRRKRYTHDIEVKNKNMLEIMCNHFCEKNGGYHKVRLYVTYHKVNYRWNGQELVAYDFMRRDRIYKNNIERG